MALKATIFKASLNISDLDRHYYEQHELVIARHPSETDQRMVLRLVAFILNAHPNLVFTKGLSTKEEPDLWQKSDQGDIALWVELGQPDEKRLRKAINQSERVIIYGLESDNFEKWKNGLVKPFGKALDKTKATGKTNTPSKLTIITIPETPIDELSSSLERSNDVQATIQDNQVWLSMGDLNVEITPQHFVIASS